MKTKITPALILLYIFQMTIPIEVKGQNPPNSNTGIDYESAYDFLPDTLPKGIRAHLVSYSARSKHDFSIFMFDDKTLAMQVHQLQSSPYYEKIMDTNLGNILWYLKWSPGDNWAEEVMYFDKEGYIYTKAKKKGWYKTPFVFLKKMMQVPFRISNGIFPELKLPDGKVKYYGMDVSPDIYPILEWAFKYKVYLFERVPELKKEFVDCGMDGACFKYTAVSGKDKGSYVVFDNWGRLVEINSINSGKIYYIYGNYNVTLPEAKLIGSF